MYIKPTVETTEEIRAKVSCCYAENQQTSVSLNLRAAYEFQIPKGNSINSKCWNVCTSDNSHLGILVQFNVGHCFRVYQYPGYTNKIEYYYQESDVNTLEKALVQFIIFHYKNHKPIKIIIKEITTTIVTRDINCE